jgi:hypothetical protein
LPLRDSRTTRRAASLTVCGRLVRRSSTLKKIFAMRMLVDATLLTARHRASKVVSGSVCRGSVGESEMSVCVDGAERPAEHVPSPLGDGDAPCRRGSSRKPSLSKWFRSIAADNLRPRRASALALRRGGATTTAAGCQLAHGATPAGRVKKVEEGAEEGNGRPKNRVSNVCRVFSARRKRCGERSLRHCT